MKSYFSSYLRLYASILQKPIYTSKMISCGFFFLLLLLTCNMRNSSVSPLAILKEVTMVTAPFKGYFTQPNRVNKFTYLPINKRPHLPTRNDQINMPGRDFFLPIYPHWIWDVLVWYCKKVCLFNFHREQFHGTFVSCSVLAVGSGKSFFKNYVTWVSQKFCNILVVRDAQARCLSWGCEGDEPLWTLRCQVRLILFRVLLTGFASIAWSSTSESTVFDRHDFA